MHKYTEVSKSRLLIHERLLSSGYRDHVPCLSTAEVPPGGDGAGVGALPAYGSSAELRSVTHCRYGKKGGAHMDIGDVDGGGVERMYEALSSL